MEPRYIVAIEIGSSKIHGAVAQVDSDSGAIQVIASEVQHAANSVRHGRVSNVQEVSDLVNGIVRKLENNQAVMPRKISEIYISLGGRSLTTVPTKASIDFANETEITADAIKRLKKEAEFGLTTTKSILDLLPRRYYVDNKEVTNMAGTFGTRASIDFTAIICAQENRANLERIKLDSPLLRRRNYLIRPLAIADMVLDSNERQLGCALVDFGAETTTLSIYKEGALQFAVTLPLGSRNVTRDLMGGLKLTEDRAEQLKIEHGNAINERPGGAPLSADQVDINQFVHARTGEIIANVIHQAEAAGYKVGDLPAGIVAVGGGARMRNFLSALSTQSKMRVRHGVADPQIHLCQGLDPDVDVDIIALLKAAAAMPGNSCLFLDRTLVEKTEPESGHRPDDEAAADNYRRPVNESDSDLLDDDPDDEFEARPPKKQGWFSRMLNRRKADERREQLLEDARRDEEERRERQRQRREDQETIDPMADEDDSDDMAEIDYAETKSLIGKFKNKVTSYLERGTEADLDDRNN
jgi:cell division protein FtsA